MRARSREPLDYSSRSTITSEIARNGWAVVSGGKRVAGIYAAGRAHHRARLRAGKLRVPRKLQLHTALWELVLKHLRRGLSPEQIAGTLASMQSPVQISYEAIYTALYAMPRGALRESVLKLLRRGHKGRRLRASARDRRNQAIPGMVLIDERPAEVDERLVPGHWEGDLMIGKGNRSQVGTLVERTTLFVALVRLDDAKAATVAAGFATILNRVDSQLRRSLTYDQGTEMAHTRPSPRRPASPSTSPIPTAPGSEASRRTPTVCSANTCPKAQTSAPSPSNNWTTSHGGSTPDHAKPSTGRHPQNSSSHQVPSTS